MSADKKIHLIPKKPNARRGAIEQAKREMPEEADAAQVIMRMRWIRYEAALKEGFSAEQAMDIIKTEIMTGK